MRIFYFNDEKHQPRLLTPQTLKDYNISHVVSFEYERFVFFDEICCDFEQDQIYSTGVKEGRILFSTKQESGEHCALFYTTKPCTSFTPGNFSLIESELAFFDTENATDAVSTLEATAHKPSVNRLLFEAFYETEIKRLSEDKPE
jgi:hypothetical protein